MVDQAFAPSRPVNPALMAGLIAAPILFVWFLLLPGYANSTRVAAFLYGIGLPALVIVAGFMVEGIG